MNKELKNLPNGDFEVVGQNFNQMSNNKYIPLPGGETCKKVNPYEQKTMARSTRGTRWYENPQWALFEATNPILPITEVMPEGETFSGSEVWQYQYSGESIWQHIKPTNYTFKEYAEFMLRQYNAATRIAIKPLKAKESEKTNSSMDKGMCGAKPPMPEEFLSVPSKPICGQNCGCKSPEDCYGEAGLNLVEKLANENPSPLLNVVENKENPEANKIWDELEKKTDFIDPFEFTMEPLPTPAVDELNLDERFYSEQEVKLIATRFARQSRNMNDVTSNDTITSYENWFRPENFKHTYSTLHNHASFVALVEGESNINIEDLHMLSDIYDWLQNRFKSLSEDTIERLSKPVRDLLLHNGVNVDDETEF